MSENKKVKKLQSLINGYDRLIKRLSDKEMVARKRWIREYHLFLKKTKEFAELKIRGTKKERKLNEAIKSWPDKSEEITKNRDGARDEIAKAKKKKKETEIELAKILAEVEAKKNLETAIVEQVFDLNKAIIEALERRNSFLTENVFDRLFDQDGNLRSQITIDNAEGTKRVRAMVNTITKVEPELAETALLKINDFFNRIQPDSEMDKATATLFELTKSILVEKTKFNIGPDFYRFISLELDSKLFPELKTAQELLRKSLRSEKTNSYIRLYERIDRTHKWRPIPQVI